MCASQELSRNSFPHEHLPIQILAYGWLGLCSLVFSIISMRCVFIFLIPISGARSRRPDNVIVFDLFVALLVDPDLLDMRVAMAVDVAAGKGAVGVTGNG